MSNYDQFRDKLREIFMMDHAELDFGIYRIMNQKRDEITKFLEKDLLPQVKKILGGATDSQSASDTKRMKEIEEQFGNTDILSLPDTIPAVAEYKKLKERGANSSGIEELENEVFNHLTIFFSRYYDNGDFVSKRRYKDNAYAIPYNGEEVKLHWANSDQYYIKTSEYFQNYTFNVTIDEKTNAKKKVHFVLKDVTTEQNNNKAASGMERRFALYQNEDEASIEVIQNEDGEDELSIYFTYELMPKSTKQEALMASAFDSIKGQLPDDFKVLTDKLCPTEKNKKRTLLEKHLTDYTAKNSFDYFIHKDLGGFLRRELDFYIKNEVLLIDDLDEKHVMQQLSLVRAIKGVGEKIITMLAQIEDFQKRLWLKKKFVVQSDYCITLDRVPESFYAEICENEAQRKEWVRLFAIDEIQGDLVTEPYSEPLTKDFLRQNPYLVLDTAFFSTSFKHRLLSKMEDVDKNCNGLLINSENFQALELLQERYRNSVRGTYYDPPYNTKKNEFCYKDTFRHSSWVSMMHDRLSLTSSLMENIGAIMISCDENEITNLRFLGNEVLGEDNYLSDIIWEGGAKNDQKYLSISHEYIVLFMKDKKHMDTTDIRWLERKEGLDKIYEAFASIQKKYPNDYEKQAKEIKVWYKSLPESEPAKKQKHFNKVEKRGLYFAADISKPENGYYYDVIHPTTGKPCKKPKGGWRFIEETMLQQIEDNRVEFGRDETTVPCRKSFLRETEYESPNTVVYLDNRVSTALIKNLFNDKKIFDNPKYYLLIARFLNLVGSIDSLYLDMFAGSGTTAHSIIHLNKMDSGKRKYLLCEMADYFKRVTKPRIEKVIYSEDWKDGKPVSRKGISQCFKYIRLEQYEDTLNNLEVKKKGDIFDKDEDFHESYMLQYMMDMDTRDSLFNIERFVHPFDVKLKTTRDNELVETNVDMVETFNYLIGLEVDTIRWTHNDEICVVEGRLHRSQDKALVIWRDTEKVDNSELNAFFRRNDYHVKDSEFDIIYVNGDNTLQNQKRDDEHWKVVLIEEEFQKRMFEEC